VPSGENSAQADCDFKENSLKCSRLGPVTSKAMVFPFCLLFLSRHFLQRGVPTIFRLSFHTTKHSSILFIVRGGTLIFGNKTLSQREGSSAPTEGIIILILGFKTVIGSSTSIEVIIHLIFGYKREMGSSGPKDGIILLIFGNKIGLGSYYPK
jgi:hypothetical protein